MIIFPGEMVRQVRLKNNKIILFIIMFCRRSASQHTPGGFRARHQQHIMRIDVPIGGLHRTHPTHFHLRRLA